MTITLKLDTTSQRAMLEDNPEFKLELSKALAQLTEE